MTTVPSVDVSECRMYERLSGATVGQRFWDTSIDRRASSAVS
jgi:hypothetical protein